MTNKFELIHLIRPWYWREVWYNIKCFFKPYNRWATKVIPRTWRDKDTLFEEILFAGIIDYVEVEKCFEIVIHEPEMEKAIKEAYNWAKVGRVKLKKEVEELESKQDYCAAVTKESELEEKDTKCLGWIITYRKYLWC